MATIRFDKISMHDRAAEPVVLAVPFARGALTAAETFTVREGGDDGRRALPCQVSTTSTWEDGSVRWLLARFLADLPGDTTHALTCGTDGVPVAPDTPVTARTTDDGVLLDTGRLCALIPRAGFDLLRWVELDGRRVLEEGALGDGLFLVDGDGNRRSTRQGTVTRLEVVESGPVRAVVEVEGRHGDGDGTLFDFRVAITAWAGKPWLEIDYQFMNREDRAVHLSQIGLQLRPARDGGAGSGPVRSATGEGYYRTSVREGPGRRLLDQQTILYQAVEHVLETFYGDFWAAWGDDERGVAVTPFQAHQNFPKGIVVSEDGIDVELFPADQPAVEILQGVAKTHRLQLLFQPRLDLEEVTSRSLQFQLPDVAILSETVYRDAGVWPPLFPERRCLRVDTRLTDLADRRGRGAGMLHWGDAPDHGYTNQGRGGGRLVWTNNEYDFPHGMFMNFARTGERRFRDAGLVAARHWMDVDFCHHSDDPLKRGGQPTHTAGHVTGSVTPSHEWTEGLLDYYHFTGQREALDKAVSIADNILRHLALPKFRDAGGFAARETGWALHGLAAVYDETRDPKYRTACDQIAGQFLQWQAERGAFIAPYTSHATARVPFMVAIAVNALKRYHTLTGDRRIAELIVSEVDDMLEHCVMDDGRFYYKELPSLQRRLGSPREMEALAHAYELSGERRFLAQLFRMMIDWVEGGLAAPGSWPKEIHEDAIVWTGPGPKEFAMAYPSLMAAYRVLAEAGVLDALEYPELPGG